MIKINYNLLLLHEQSIFQNYHLNFTSAKIYIKINLSKIVFVLCNLKKDD